MSLDVRSENMWPFRKKAPVVSAVDQFQQAKEAAFELMRRLDEGESSTSDSEVRDTFQNLAQRVQSNCDSVAQGLLVVIASLCANRRHLTPELLPDGLEPLYFLAIEDYSGFAHYLRWLADYDEPYLGTPTPSGREYLIELSESEEMIRNAFEIMFQKQDNDWRDADEDVAALPAILKTNGSESGPEE